MHCWVIWYCLRDHGRCQQVWGSVVSGICPLIVPREAIVVVDQSKSPWVPETCRGCEQVSIVRLLSLQVASGLRVLCARVVVSCAQAGLCANTQPLQTQVHVLCRVVVGVCATWAEGSLRFR
mmetsp:Transcript_22045/g.53677  ORF Transcript_22045/g.53677 Transcript_22045/m.53677 type:complete len:122 (+) Transcript_22045:1012-1377(+)